MLPDKTITILVVDDNQEIRQMIADLLREAGFKNVMYASTLLILLHYRG